MIPDRSGVTVDSTVQGEDVAMTIAADATQHLMNILTDLYADSELAVIREYACNALDSHIEAGTTRPIEVTTPTALRPLLTIRDYGVGLDADAIRDIYSRYGASTKRATNDAVGMLGLGCKSALAYVDQFTLAGIKDGQRMLVSISRDEAGAGTMTVLEAGDTDEPDGVEICIPTDDEYTLEQKARDFFSYWEPGLVLLNGAEPAPLEGYAVGDYIVADRDTSYAATGRHDRNPLTIIMGNVSYPPPDGYEHPAVDSLPRDKRLVVRVPIGAVHFTPSREGLQDSPQTRKALDLALEGFQREVEVAVADAITNAPSKSAAARALIEATAAFGKTNLPEIKWEGEEIPTVLSAEDLDPVPIRDGDAIAKPASLWAAKIVSGYHGGQSARVPAGQITLEAAGKNPWVLGYPNAKWSATQRRKLDRYVSYHGLREETSKVTYFITDSHAVPRPDWIDGAVTAINWQDVRNWKDPEKANEAVSGGGVKYAGTYPTFTADGYWMEKYPADELPTSGRNLYYVVGDKCDYRAKCAIELMSNDVFVVCLTAARADKFKRTFPHARDAVAAAERGVRGWYKSLSEESKLAIVVGPQIDAMYGGLFVLPADKVDDPELSKLLRLHRLWTTGTLKARWEDRAHFMNIPDDAPSIDARAISGRYPLIANEFQSTIESHEDHAIMYVNAVYAANEGSN